MFINENELNEFKNQVQKLYGLLSNLSKVWDFEAYTILTVLVQNLYYAEGQDKINQIVSAIHMFSDYRGKVCYLSTFVSNEVSMLLDSIYNEC